MKRPSPTQFYAYATRAAAIGMALRFDGKEYVITGRDGINRHTARWTLARRFIEAEEADARAA